MELSEVMKTKIQAFVSDTGEDVNVIQKRWEESNIEDENLRAIQCAILSDKEAYKNYKTWSNYDLTKYGIESIYTFWNEVVSNNLDKIKTEVDAIKVVHEVLVKKLRSQAKRFRGAIVSIGNKNDNFSAYISEVLNNYKQDPEQMIATKQVKVFSDIETAKAEFPEISKELDRSAERYFTDGNYVIPIGKKDIIVTGRDGKKKEKKNWYNGRYDDKPVVGSSYMQSLELILKDVNSKDSKYKWYSEILNDEQCDISKPNSMMIETIANVSPSDSSRLNPTKDTKFNIIGDIEPDEFEEIKKVAMRRSIQFNGILDYIKTSGGGGFDTKVLDAKIIDVTRRETGATILIGDTVEKTVEDMEKLFDDDTGELKDNSIYGRVPSEIPIKFGDGSKVLLFGNPDYASKREGDNWIKDNTKPFLWIRGVLVPKDQQIEEQNINVSQDEIDTTQWKGEEKKEDEKIEGGDTNGGKYQV